MKLTTALFLLPALALANPLTVIIEESGLGTTSGSCYEFDYYCGSYLMSKKGKIKRGVARWCMLELNHSSIYRLHFRRFKTSLSPGWALWYERAWKHPILLPSQQRDRESRVLPSWLYWGRSWWQGRSLRTCVCCHSWTKSPEQRRHCTHRGVSREESMNNRLSTVLCLATCNLQQIVLGEDG